MIDWFTGILPCIHRPLPAGSVVSVDADGAVEWETVILHVCLISETQSFFFPKSSSHFLDVVAVCKALETLPKQRMSSSSRVRRL
ncbi:Phage/plasmid replication protein, gene II/X family [Yersinia enterocolitica subsp. enterocolitica]|nr:Phage/plasmid replication protein, gene II/X family [Yersinia enterocolitica subsp. enterocolitica]